MSSSRKLHFRGFSSQRSALVLPGFPSQECVHFPPNLQKFPTFTTFYSNGKSTHPSSFLRVDFVAPCFPCCKSTQHHLCHGSQGSVPSNPSHFPHYFTLLPHYFTPFLHYFTPFQTKVFLYFCMKNNCLSFTVLLTLL